MEKIKKYGIIHIVLSYVLILIAPLLKPFTNKINKDIFLVCFILSLIVMIDARMRFNSVLVKINYWIICVFFIFHFVVIMI